MKTPLYFDHDDRGILALGEREQALSEALCYLDRAIGQLAAAQPPSRWLSCHQKVRRHGFLGRRLPLLMSH